jgi:NAD(P) transhydrogenase subunit beta
MNAALLQLAYLVAAILFILGLRQLSHPRTAPKGNATSATGMLIAVVATLLHAEIVAGVDIVIGLVVGAAIGAILAVYIQMTAMPQLVALFNGLGGAASALVAGTELVRPQTGALGNITLIAITVGILIGTVTFTGSVVAFAKLQEIVPGGAIRSSLLQIVNALLTAVTLALCATMVVYPENLPLAASLVAAAGLLGVLGVMGIGGADMPVVIAFLNALSGLAASATGFALANDVLIVAGSLVGASGVILTNIMCKGMNRTLGNVLFSGFGAAGTVPAAAGAAGATGTVKGATAEEAAMIMASARLVVVIPGYGLAVAQAQHTLRQLADELDKKGVDVLYAIHPVAGRMPGHMNVLLAEADVPYDKLKDLDEINPSFPEAEVALVVGANDVVNPVARTDTSSPIYGMPILDADKAGSCIVLKRSMRPGFSGIDNPLYTLDRTMMVFGDAKDTLVELVTHVKQS